MVGVAAPSKNCTLDSASDRSNFLPVSVGGIHNRLKPSVLTVASAITSWSVAALVSVVRV